MPSHDRQTRTCPTACCHLLAPPVGIAGGEPPLPFATLDLLRVFIATCTPDGPVRPLSACHRPSPRGTPSSCFARSQLRSRTLGALCQTLTPLKADVDFLILPSVLRLRQAALGGCASCTTPSRRRGCRRTCCLTTRRCPFGRLLLCQAGF